MIHADDPPMPSGTNNAARKPGGDRCVHQTSIDFHKTSIRYRLQDEVVRCAETLLIYARVDLHLLTKNKPTNMDAFFALPCLCSVQLLHFVVYYLA